MRKFIALFTMLFALILASPSFAAVGIKVDNAYQGTATDFDFKSIGSQLTNDGSTWTFNLLLAGVGNGGATSMTTSTLAVPITHGFIRKAIAADSAFTAGTLANGVEGQLLTIYITEDEGSETFTVTPTTATTVSTIAFDAVGETATLLYVDDTVGWVVFTYNGATITLP